MSMIWKSSCSYYEPEDQSSLPHPHPCPVGGAGCKDRGRIIYHVLLTRWRGFAAASSVAEERRRGAAIDQTAWVPPATSRIMHDVMPTLCSHYISFHQARSTLQVDVDTRAAPKLTVVSPEVQVPSPAPAASPVDPHLSRPRLARPRCCCQFTIAW